MKNNLISEINQMKYLFGYKAGKVISEQDTGGNEPTPSSSGVTIDGEVYRFPGITDATKLKTFTQMDNIKVDDLGRQMGVDQRWINDAIATRDRNKQAYGNPRVKQELSHLNALRNYTDDALNYIAKRGLLPNTLTNPQAQQEIFAAVPELKNYLSYQKGPEGVAGSTTFEGPLDIPEYFNFLSKLVTQRMQLLK